MSADFIHGSFLLITAKETLRENAQETLANNLIRSSYIHLLCVAQTMPSLPMKMVLPALQNANLSHGFPYCTCTVFTYWIFLMTINLCITMMLEIY
jgi:hypothetical protein